jgi:hypothetical protein
MVWEYGVAISRFITTTGTGFIPLKEKKKVYLNFANGLSTLNKLMGQSKPKVKRD